MLAELKIEVTPELLKDASSAAAKIVFEYGALSLLTGGIGTIARFAYDAADSAELADLTFKILDIAFPEWGIGSAFGKISAEIDEQYDYYQKLIGNTFVKAAFEIGGADAMIIADGSSEQASELWRQKETKRTIS